MDIARVTLHVGLGTFHPVKVEMTEHHAFEPGMVDGSGGEDQPKNMEPTNVICGNDELHHRTCGGERTLKSCSGWTEIFIYPGYQFKILDGLITTSAGIYTDHAGLHWRKRACHGSL